MGTRAIVRFYDCNENAAVAKPLAAFYKHFDGYPQGLGAWLGDFLYERILVNGYSVDTPAKANNGMGCLAAEVIARLKSEKLGGKDGWTARFKNPYIGASVSLIDPTEETDWDIEYEYHVFKDRVRVIRGRYVDLQDAITIFSAPWDAMVMFSEKYTPAE